MIPLVFSAGLLVQFKFYSITHEGPDGIYIRLNIELTSKDRAMSFEAASGLLRNLSQNLK